MILNCISYIYNLLLYYTAPLLVRVCPRLLIGNDITLAAWGCRTRVVLLGKSLVGAAGGAAGSSITSMLEPIGTLLEVLEFVTDGNTDDGLDVSVRMLFLHGFNLSKCTTSFLLV